MLNQAVGDGVLPSHPCRVKGVGLEHAPARPVVTPEQVTQLAAAIDSEYSTMVLLARMGRCALVNWLACAESASIFCTELFVSRSQRSN
jgi:hypothetical protein